MCASGASSSSPDLFEGIPAAVPYEVLPTSCVRATRHPNVEKPAGFVPLERAVCWTWHLGSRLLSRNRINTNRGVGGLPDSVPFDSTSRQSRFVQTLLQRLGSPSCARVSLTKLRQFLKQ